MRSGWVVFCTLVGCGRLSFDPQVVDAQVVDSDSDGPATTCPTYGPWGTPALLPGNINSDGIDVDPFLTVDGLTLYFVTDRGPALETWKTTRATPTSPWGAAAIVPELSHGDGNDGNPVLTSDELEIYFGRGTLYEMTRAAKTSSFANIQIVSSTAYMNPLAGALSSDDLELYLGMAPVIGGSQHIYRVTRADRAASFDLDTGVSLPFTMEQEYPAISSTDLEIVYTNSPAGNLDLYRMTRGSTAVEFSLASEESLGVLNNDAFDDADPTFSVDGRTIIFDSARPAALAEFNLYSATRECL